MHMHSMKVIFQVLLDDLWEKTNQIDSKVSKQISFVGAIRGVIEVCHMNAMHMHVCTCILLMYMGRICHMLANPIFKA